MFVKLFCFFLFTFKCIFCQEDQLTIGAIFYQDEAEDLRLALEVGASVYNFTVSVKEVSKRGQYLEISEHVCSLMQEKVIGIIDGTGGRASEHIQALSDIYELPHVMIEHNDLYSRNWSLLSLYPSADAFNMALERLITVKDWNNFTILYMKGHPITRVAQLLQMGNDTDRYTVSVRELSGDDYRDVLINAKHSGYYNFVVDCPSRNLEQLLLQAQQVGLMADEHSYIFVSPDLFTQDLSRYRYGGVNMTGLRLFHLEQSDALIDFIEKYNDKRTAEYLSAENMKLKIILIYDAVKVFYEGVEKINRSIIKTESLSCHEDQAWTYGSTLLNFMKTNRVEGVTRTIVFNGLGQRTNVYFDILEVTPSGEEMVGTWRSDNLTITRTIVPVANLDGQSIMRNKTFRVLIAKTAPFGYVKLSDKILEGNDRYEGFTIDLIDRLAELLEFNYEFEMEDSYGSFENNKWNGMVGKLIEEKADFAICDFTITLKRQAVIDFSTPFMTTGISILYKEPSKQPPELFAFMAVFSPEVWWYMLFVQMGIGVIMIFVGRISHKEWQNPVPCIEQPEELTNQFSFANSIWLIIGSVMQQGSEIAPIALAPRMITSVWWFFTMVMVASYVGTLVAFLTTQNDVVPFSKAEDLANQKSIEYGAKDGGATHQFFENSKNPIFQSMATIMKNKGWLVDDNDKGVIRAEERNYAIFMELAAIEYYKERHCDLIQVGQMLDSKAYGIGMKKGSPYKKDIDNALLLLKENGEIKKMKDLWWNERRGGGKCGVKSSAEQKQLTMNNMKGAFVVLGAGSFVGLLISILDMLWGVFKRSVKYKTTFKYELIEELKFALKFSGDVKPVKRPPTTEDGSDEALAADKEENDELGSLRSARTLRSGKSSSTPRSIHSHSSRHSGSALSVAFARRRQYT